MAGTFLSGRLAGRLSHAHAVDLAYGLMLTGALINLALATGIEPNAFWVIAPLVLYASGMSLAMPNLSLMALDLFPAHRGLTSALLGFLQTGSNALVAGLLATVAGAAAADPGRRHAGAQRQLVSCCGGWPAAALVAASAALP